jgi:hypothetical protein
MSVLIPIKWNTHGPTNVALSQLGQFRDPDAKYLVRLWEQADRDQSNSLSQSEIEKLVASLNINMSSRCVGLA